MNTTPVLSRRVLGAFLVCASLAVSAEAQLVLYAGTSGNDPSGGLFGTLDPTTVQFTQLGDPTTDGPLPGIALNSAGQMFGTNNVGGGSGGTGVLIRIDPTTGALLGTVGPIIDSGDSEPLKVTDIAFQPGTDILFGITGPPNNPKEGNLYTISTTTAVATLVGNTGLERGGLAFAPDGALYLATVGDDVDPVIARIDPATAAVVGTPAELSDDGIDALAIRPTDGVVFGSGADSSQFFTIDPTNGSQTLIGSDDAPGSVVSLTFLPGEPVQPAVPAPALAPITITALFVALLICGYVVLARRSPASRRSIA